jgi:hypothetical protein
MIMLICCGFATIAALAREPMQAAPPEGEPQADTHQSNGLRPKAARPQLRVGRNTIYTNEQGRKLQAVVNRRGVVTGYVMVDATGKVSKMEVRTSRPTALEPGQIALVRQCIAITKECLDNPIPRSMDPDDCLLIIPCPNTGAFSNQLSR